MSEPAPAADQQPSNQEQANEETVQPADAQAPAPAQDDSAQASLSVSGETASGNAVPRVSVETTTGSSATNQVGVPDTPAADPAPTPAASPPEAPTLAVTSAPETLALTPAMDDKDQQIAALQKQVALFGESLTQAQALLSRVTTERDTLQEHYDRVYAEWNQLHRDLDAVRAELADLKSQPAPETFAEERAGLQSRLDQEVAAHEQTKQERDLLAAAQPTGPDMSVFLAAIYDTVSRSVAATLEAHAVPAVAEAVADQAEEAPTLQSPFISRGQS